MPTFEPGMDPKSAPQVNFEKCLIYVKKQFPNEPPHIQMKMAEGVYAISQVFFTMIIPSVLQQTMRPSLN